MGDSVITLLDKLFYIYFDDLSNNKRFMPILNLAYVKHAPHPHPHTKPFRLVYESLILTGSAMFSSTFNLVTRVRLP